MMMAADSILLLCASCVLQCFTEAGFGRTSTRGADGKVTLSATACPVGTYNVGQNTAGCQKCGAGLTTAGEKSKAADDCSKFMQRLHACVGVLVAGL